jgi:hypothetical protein
MNIFDMFPAFERCRPSNGTETGKKLFVIQWGALWKQFSVYIKDFNIAETHLPRTECPD